jgi:hypothetical protein
VKLYYSLSNQGCCGAAIAEVAIANRGNVASKRFRFTQFGESPSIGAVRNPSLLSVGRRNPNSGFASTVSNQKRPLGFKFGDVLVVNLSPSEWVYNEQRLFSKHKFGSNPNQIGCGCHQNSYQQIGDQILTRRRVEQGLGEKQQVERERTYAPKKIRLGSKDNFATHKPIFAGVFKMKEMF